MAEQEIVAHKSSDWFVACQHTNGRPSVMVHAADLSVLDAYDEHEPINFACIIVDVGPDRLRLNVHEDGSYTLENWEEDGIDPTSWREAIRVGSGDMHLGTLTATGTATPTSEGGI